jgi:hypothetical protein
MSLQANLMPVTAIFLCASEHCDFIDGAMGATVSVLSVL